MASVGYTELSAEHKATEIIESKGTQEELTALGFTEENANKVVGTILLNPKERATDRLKAAELVYKVKGSFQPEASNDGARVVNIFNNPTFELATRTYEQSLKAIISHATNEPVSQETQAADEHSGTADAVNA